MLRSWDEPQVVPTWDKRRNEPPNEIECQDRGEPISASQPGLQRGLLHRASR